MSGANRYRGNSNVALALIAAALIGGPIVGGLIGRADDADGGALFVLVGLLVGGVLARLISRWDRRRREDRNGA